MAESKENLAKVALYDPVRQNLRSTRYALSELGFRDVDAFADLKDMRTRVSEDRADLIICESGDDPKVYEFVKDVRNDRSSANPFSVIFLTCWRRDPDHIHAALKSGADDLFVRPFSTNFLENRVQAALESRKRFVVTSDYVGPDRRSSDRESALSPKYLDPPNTLRHAVKGDQAALEDSYYAIAETLDAVIAERARRLAVRIAADFDLTDPLKAESEISIIRQARELTMLAAQVSEQAGAMAGALVKALTDSGSSTPEKRWRVCRELALGVSISCGGGAEDEASAEIDQLVSALRKKDANVAIDGGASPTKRLNSAA